MQEVMSRYPREPASAAQHREEEEPITFDYLLKKVIDNTTGVTSSGRRNSRGVEEPEPVFEVHINEDDVSGERKVAVTQARVPTTAPFTAFEEEKKSSVQDPMAGWSA